VPLYPYGVAIGLLRLTMFRSSDDITYTKYKLVDNELLHVTVELAEKKDTEAT